MVEDRSKSAEENAVNECITCRPESITTTIHHSGSLGRDRERGSSVR